jgi:hypothetical protein
MKMKKMFSNEQLAYIRDQAMIYQCACPAQICESIQHIRDLYDQQIKCIELTDTDKAVHGRIKESTENTHKEFEQCLTDVLKLEKWDMETLKMPEYLIKRLIQE